MASKNSIGSNSPIEVAKGGTNASSMATTYGVNYFDGTRLVTSAVGTATHVLTSNGVGVAPTFQVAGGGDVSAGANLTDNAVVRGDGGAKGVQTSTMLISDNGEMTNASQPAFLAIVNVQLNNVTGDGTLYTIPFANEIYDQNNDFDATSTFTAPVTGKYNFQVNTEFGGVAAGHVFGNIYIVASNRTLHNTYAPNKVDNNNLRVSFDLSKDIDMDAADTCVCKIDVGGAAKAIAIVNTGSSTFSGHLVC